MQLSTDPAAARAPGHRLDPATFAQMRRLVSDLGVAVRERDEALDLATRSQHEALLRLALAAGYRGGQDAEVSHLLRVGFLAEALARLLGQEDEFALLLRRAAPLHDLGHVGVPDAVLSHPGPLDAPARAALRRHPRIGAELLGRSRVPVFQVAAEIALMHHERWDGTGYPHGVAGDDIPLSARIVAVVDHLDALASDRPWRPAHPMTTALGLLAAERGAALDARIVDVLIDHAPMMAALRAEVDGAGQDLALLMADDPFRLRARCRAGRPS